MTDQFGVPVRTMLPASTFVKLERAAKAHHTTVGALVAECVRRALLVAGGPQEHSPAVQRALEAEQRKREREKAVRQQREAAAAQRSAAKVAAQDAKKRDHDNFEARRAAEITRRRLLTAAERSIENARLDERIRELHAQQLSDVKIARELLMSQPVVSERRRAMGLESHFASSNNRGRA